MATAIFLGAVTGLRRGELCALRWSSVHLEEGLLDVAESLTVIGGQVTVGGTKTHQARRMALDTSAVDAIGRRVAYQRWLAERTGVDLVADPWLLSRRANGADPPLPDGVTQAFSRYCKALGMPYHFHELRHFLATVGVASGQDVRTVAGRLGHADPSMTLRVYAHAQEVTDRELARLVGEAVASQRKALPAS